MESLVLFPLFAHITSTPPRPAPTPDAAIVSVYRVQPPPTFPPIRRGSRKHVQVRGVVPAFLHHSLPLARALLLVWWRGRVLASLFYRVPATTGARHPEDDFYFILIRYLLMLMLNLCSTIRVSNPNPSSLAPSSTHANAVKTRARRTSQEPGRGGWHAVNPINGTPPPMPPA